MRKIVYLLFLPLTFAVNSASAQDFTMQHDTVKIAGTGYLDIYNYINNNTSDTIRVSWRIIDETLPQSWKDHAEFGLCDNVLCYTKAILGGSMQTTDTISAGKQTLFKMQIDLSPATVTATGNTPVYVTAELTFGSTIDTATFAVYKFPTGINKTGMAKEDVTLYPNPAYNDLNITFSKDAGVKTIAIYNLIGKQVSVYRASGNSAKLDLEKVPSGIYFVRLIDNAGRVVATRRFTHQ